MEFDLFDPIWIWRGPIRYQDYGSFMRRPKTQQYKQDKQIRAREARKAKQARKKRNKGGQG